MVITGLTRQSNHLLSVLVKTEMLRENSSVTIINNHKTAALLNQCGTKRFETTKMDVKLRIF